ncbi:outer membrane protein assembly factor BamE [Pelagibacteraceae bacterium]|jgi:outer membrane protein assembly factor BamE (lipoprotein component of BamABCDE complex)|nr:outer membrane protein assembly factor BamE [Pelagibacteraceae bacterium]MDC1158524.1 outer membrane protein assembly factor BamE [Pelagibacteraceae bacterium]
MSLNVEYHKIIKTFLVCLFLFSCQLKEPQKNHGILFLKNRSDSIQISKSNKNDILKSIGQPHSISINDENEWFYIERVLVKGKYHKLGKNILKTNNVLVVKFDKFGILKEKRFYDKNSKEMIKFSEKVTDNDLSKKSFVEKFFGSLRNKMYKRK